MRLAGSEGGAASLGDLEMTPEADPLKARGKKATAASVAAFPTEPFPCPACGQMLGASCRVCVACQHVLDPAEIAAAHHAATPPLHPARAGEAKPATVRYPWRFFFAVLLVSFLLTELFMQLWGIDKAQLAMATAQALAGIWAFFDALRRRIPRPLRWGVGSMLLPVVIFPWYLARRKMPQATCPFYEAEMKPVTRILLYAFLTFLFLSAVIYLVHGPVPK